MRQLRIRLFGKLSVRSNGQPVEGFEGCKCREIFSYLLLNRHIPHPREALAALLWGDSTTSQSKKYLRQTLWQIQTNLQQQTRAGTPGLLLADDDWVQVNPTADLWLDVATFESAYNKARGVQGDVLDASQAEALREAVGLYRGDLLEGCYRDWCLHERERLQSNYLIMLDKLMSWCEVNRHYEAGLCYGQVALRFERARESTHRRLMRLYYLAGDRTSALRQYARCAAALSEELGVDPARRTTQLYEQIRADEFRNSVSVPVTSRLVPEPLTPPLPEVVNHLHQVRAALADIQRGLQRDIQVVDLALESRNLSSDK